MTTPMTVSTTTKAIPPGNTYPIPSGHTHTCCPSIVLDSQPKCSTDSDT